MARGVVRAARVGIWALPGYAVVWLYQAFTGQGSGLGRALLGVVALAALAVLLAHDRSGASRWLGAAGLMAGLAGLAYTYHQPVDAAGWLLLAGPVLVTLGWLLLGLAGWCSGVVSRSDAVLLVLAGPLFGVAGQQLAVLAPAGALLLLAAGIGIAWPGSRTRVAAATVGVGRHRTAG